MPMGASDRGHQHPPVTGPGPQLKARPGDDRSIAGVILSLQAGPGNRAVAATLGARPGLPVQRLVNYAWDWYSWRYAWKAGAKDLWQKIDAKFNRELLPLIKGLEQTLPENEIFDLLQFRNRNDGKKISFAEGTTFLDEVEGHLATARSLKERPPTVGEQPAPKSKADEEKGDDSTPPVRVEDQPKVEEVKGDDTAVGKPADETTGDGEPPLGETPDKTAGLKPVEETSGEGKPPLGGTPGDKPGEMKAVEETKREDKPIGNTSIEDKHGGDASVTGEPVRETTVADKEVEEKAVVKKQPPKRGNPVRRPKGKPRSKTVKEKVEDVVPEAPKGVTSPTAKEMTDALYAKVEGFRSAIQAFTEDHRPLRFKAPPALKEAEAAVGAIRSLEKGIAAYLQTISDRKAQVDKDLDAADYEVVQDLSDESVAFETLVREGGIEHMGVDDEVTDLEGEVDLLLNAANAGAELIRLRRLWTSEASARGHFIRHTGDTGLATEHDYLTAAEDLTKNGGATHSKLRTNGDTAYFSTATGYFSSVKSNGAIRTLFHPGGAQNGLAYYNRQT